jgi:hypothetical protein
MVFLFLLKSRAICKGLQLFAQVYYFQRTVRDSLNLAFFSKGPLRLASRNRENIDFALT